ncbi:MAG: type II toxin-antitoxin system RelE/ParE family toxin [Polyangiaceae bacterium]|nr:type II toxin-antitoxin system RelE/ParE family toxin [Polyangiaceae bacterium]
MPVIVLLTETFRRWYKSLDDADSDAVQVKVRLLQSLGVSLGFPHSSTIHSSRFALRELRIQSSGKPLRVLYAFDPKRSAVLLLGGDKTGNNRWYEENVPKSEMIWQEYLAGICD